MVTMNHCFVKGPQYVCKKKVLWREALTMTKNNVCITGIRFYTLM